MALQDRLPRLLEAEKEDLPTLRLNASDPVKDRSGTATSCLQMALRFVGVAEFAVTGDVGSFRRHLAESARLRLRLFERHARGEAIDESYLSMLAYKAIFDALAAGDMTTSHELGELLGGRPHIENEHDHRFDRCLGYALKSLVCGLSDETASRLADFTSICRQPKHRAFAGYSVVLGGILDRDTRRVQAGLAAVAEGHENLSKRGRVFHGCEDEVISVWGVAVANLARSRGMFVTGVPPLIPDELLCLE